MYVFPCLNIYLADRYPYSIIKGTISYKIL